MNRVVSLLLLLAPSIASAVPMQLQHQGRMFDALGSPLDGQHDLDLKIYGTPSGGTALWSESLVDVDFDGGYFAVTLGEVSTLDTAVFDDDELYLAISVDGGAELAGRQVLVSVPFAIRATTADSALGVSGGGTVEASEVIVGGTTVIDSSGMIPYSQISGTPQDALAALGCSASGQIPLYDGTSWSCGTRQDDASALTTGVIDINRLPVGSSADTVAAGNHTHVAADVTGGTFDIALIPVGGSATEVAAGDHTHDSVPGSLKLGDDPSTCDSAKAGAIRFSSGVFEGCDGTAWLSMATLADGSAQSLAVPSCSELLKALPATPDGVYWLDPTGGSTADAFQTYCDMTTDGGGWSLVYNHNYTKANRSQLISSNMDTMVNPDGPGTANNFRLPRGVWNDLSPKKEYLYKAGSRQSGTAPADFWIKQTSTFINDANGRLTHDSASTLAGSDACLQLEAIQVHTAGPFQGTSGGTPGGWQSPHCSGNGVPWSSINCWCSSMGNENGQVTPSNCGSGSVSGHMFWDNNNSAQRCGSNSANLSNSQYASVGLYVR